MILGFAVATAAAAFLFASAFPAYGAAIASLPWLLLGLCSAPNYASTDGLVTYNNGVITLYGLLNLATLVGEVAGLGFFAGVVFWFAVAFSSRRTN